MQNKYLEHRDRHSGVAWLSSWEQQKSFDSAINSKPRNHLRQRTPRDEASPKGLNRFFLSGSRHCLANRGVRRIRFTFALVDHTFISPQTVLKTKQHPCRQCAIFYYAGCVRVSSLGNLMCRLFTLLAILYSLCFTSQPSPTYFHLNTTTT
jgi:hypothetical protein